MGGTLVDYKAARLKQRELFLFDLDISIEMRHLEGTDLSELVEAINRIIAPKLGRNRASLHMTVNPVGSDASAKLKAA